MHRHLGVTDISVTNFDHSTHPAARLCPHPTIRLPGERLSDRRVSLARRLLAGPAAARDVVPAAPRPPHPRRTLPPHPRRRAPPPGRVRVRRRHVGRAEALGPPTGHAHPGPSTRHNRHRRLASAADSVGCVPPGHHLAIHDGPPPSRYGCVEGNQSSRSQKTRPRQGRWSDNPLAVPASGEPGSHNSRSERGCNRSRPAL